MSWILIERGASLVDVRIGIQFWIALPMDDTIYWTASESVSQSVSQSISQSVSQTVG